MSLIQLMLSREGLDTGCNEEPCPETLQVIEQSDAEEDPIDNDLVELDKANAEATEVEDAVEEIGDSVESMESLVERIASATTSGGKLTPRELTYISNEAQAIYASLGVVPTAVVATESIDADNNAELAMEALADVAEKLVEGLKSALGRIGGTIKNFWDRSISLVGRLRKRAVGLKEKLQTVGEISGETRYSKSYDDFEKIPSKLFNASKAVLVEYQNALVSYVKGGCEGSAPKLDRFRGALKGLPRNPTVIRVMDKYDLFEVGKKELRADIKLPNKAALVKAMDDVIALCDQILAARLGWLKSTLMVEDTVGRMLNATTKSFGATRIVRTGAEIPALTAEMGRIRNIVGAALRAPRDFVVYESSTLAVVLNLTARAIKASHA